MSGHADVLDLSAAGIRGGAGPSVAFSAPGKKVETKHLQLAG
jgi:hypothetical protein